MEWNEINGMNGMNGMIRMKWNESKEWDEET